MSEATVRKGHRPSSHGCNLDIHIDNHGDINICSCNQPGKGGGQAEPPSQGDQPCPRAPGACVPLGLGAKPKQSRRRKLDKLLQNNRVPSALAAAFFHTARRFRSGETAQNPLEARIFSRLNALSPQLRGVLSCAIDSHDELDPGELGRLEDASLTGDPAQAVDANSLAEAFASELVQRAGLQVFADPLGVEEERPGLMRVVEPGDDVFESPVNVCKVNGLRTVTFRPPLSLGEYTPAELQQQCTPVLQNGQVVPNCALQTPPCPGNSLENVCLRVPEVEAGSAVLVEGVNFFSVDATVELTLQPTASITVGVEAHVVGDIETPLEGDINGQTVLIRDCHVHDRLTFRVPDTLPPALYSFQVVVPNTTGIAIFGQEIRSAPQFITVVPPSTARFQIATELLGAREETSPASFGSDEVGIKFLTVPLLPDGSTGETQKPNGDQPVRFGDVDSGENRTMNVVLFTHQQPISAVVVAVLGYEIDSESAFEDQVDSFSEAFVNIVKDQLSFIKEVLSAVGGYEALKGLGVKGAIAAAIAAAVLLAVDFFVALWAPADLIIEDTLALTAVDLGQLTSAGFPLPTQSSFKTPGDIQVNVFPIEKVATQYRERREYVSDEEDSRYEITYRYNRIA